MKRLAVAPKCSETAVTEEDFLSWDKPTQNEWIKEHPTSKFADLKGKSGKPKKGATLVPDAPKTPKLSAEEKKAQAEKHFNELMKTKSESDRKAFLEAKKDGIAIPPAWTDVTYNSKPVEGVIARGTDAKGRKQRLEDPEWREKQIREKHTRIQKDLEPIFDSNVKKLRSMAKKDDPESQVLYLITQTGFRIGGKGDGKAKTTAYGASTLLGKHVKVKGSTVQFDFIGKEGIRQQHTIKDPVIAQFVSGKADDEPLFKTNQDKIRDRWKELGGYKVHDIRSLLATRMAKKRLNELIPPPPRSEKEKKAILKDIADKASARLGNKPAEALNTYIDHSVFNDLKVAK